MNKLLIIASIALLQACGGDLGNDKCNIPVEVIEVGQCGGGEGFFSGSRECQIKYKNNVGLTGFAKVYDGAMSGQTAYKHCWSDDGKRSCFATYRTNVRSSYSKLCK